MAHHAALLNEQPLAPLHIARWIEVVEREEERYKVARLTGAHLRANDAVLPHRFAHLGKMIPQCGGEIIKRVALRDTAEVGSNRRPKTVHRMAFHAPLGSEDARAGERVLGYLRPLLRDRDLPSTEGQRHQSRGQPSSAQQLADHDSPRVTEHT
jgi:hypothetical protein